MTANGPRPGGVTLVGILLFVFGFLYVVGSVLGLLDEKTRNTLGVWAIVVSLIIGVVYLLVAKGILNGNRGSRFLVGLLTVIELIGGVLLILGSFWNQYPWNALVHGIVTVLVSLVILLLLYGRNARIYFA